MFERPASGERALLVRLDIAEAPDPEAEAEFKLLAKAAGADAVAWISGRRSSPDPSLFIGRGKVEEIKQTLLAEQAELVLFDHTLTPGQERNLEREFDCRVVDRTGLILDIFAQRARSFEGKLQVELAQLRHLSTRLVRGWTHLERQKGGIGLRGPGETQLETDRRLLNQRISQLNRRLAKVAAQRNQSRRARQRAEIPTISLVGYTNAGKSTLFNRLTEASVYAADQLFATLDPTLRRLTLSQGQAVILADTVGFVRQLPHELIAAFRSTLQETTSATLLLHVIDASSPQHTEQIEQVEAVLEQIGADTVPQIKIYNKIDQLTDQPAQIERDTEGQIQQIWLSAKTGVGLDLLDQALTEWFQRDQVCHRLQLNPDDGRLRARLYQLGTVRHEQVTPSGGWQLEVTLPKLEFERLARHEQGILQRLVR